MAQTKTRSTSFSSIVGSAAFRKGVEDFQMGNDFDPFYTNKARGRSNWDYEYGRLYAAACRGEGVEPLPNRDGRYVSRRAIRHFAAHYESGIV